MPRDDFNRRRLRSLYERNKRRVSALADARDRRRSGDDDYAAPRRFIVSERRTRMEGFGRGGMQVRKVIRWSHARDDGMRHRRFSDGGIFRRGHRDRFARDDDYEREERRERFREGRSRRGGALADRGVRGGRLFGGARLRHLRLRGGRGDGPWGRGEPRGRRGEGRRGKGGDIRRNEDRGARGGAWGGRGDGRRDQRRDDGARRQEGNQSRGNGNGNHGNGNRQNGSNGNGNRQNGNNGNHKPRRDNRQPIPSKADLDAQLDSYRAN